MKLYNDDCLKVLPTLNNQSIDFILTDPPYGTTQCKWDSIIPFEPMWKELKRIIKDNGCIALFGTEPFSSHLRLSNLDWFKYDWIWDKVVGSSFVLSKKQPLRRYEIISVFYKIQCPYFPIMESRPKNNERVAGNRLNKVNRLNKINYIKTSTVNKKKYPTNILLYNRMSNELNSSKLLHPTQKPVALLEYLIKTYTNENDTVLDFTMGSGSTGVACKNLNREFIGIELDKKYFDIAKDRINGIIF